VRSLDNARIFFPQLYFLGDIQHRIFCRFEIKTNLISISGGSSRQQAVKTRRSQQYDQRENSKERAQRSV
jgi:hypothetical protein